jgi:hypothetical protein
MTNTAPGDWTHIDLQGGHVNHVRLSHKGLRISRRLKIVGGALKRLHLLSQPKIPYISSNNSAIAQDSANAQANAYKSASAQDPAYTLETKRVLLRRVSPKLHRKHFANPCPRPWSVETSLLWDNNRQDRRTSRCQKNNKQFSDPGCVKEYIPLVICIHIDTHTVKSFSSKGLEYRPVKPEGECTRESP